MRMSQNESDKSERLASYINRRKSFKAENASSSYDFDFDGRQYGTVSNEQNRYIQDTEPKPECSELDVTLKTEGEQYGFSLHERTREGSQVNCYYLYITPIVLFAEILQRSLMKGC